MRFSWFAAVSSLTVVGVFAQQHPAPLASSRPVFHGGGNGNRGPAGGPPRVGPIGQHPIGQRPIGGPVGSPRIVIVPLYVGGGYYYGDPYSQQNIAPPAQQPLEPPSVMINQGYQPEVQHPALYDYSNVPLPPSPPLEERQSVPPPATIQQDPADQSPTIYLIALKDGSIVAALGYWVKDDTLSYTTREGNENRVSLDRVDREFSNKLNADRNIDFKLP